MQQVSRVVSAAGVPILRSVHRTWRGLTCGMTGKRVGGLAARKQGGQSLLEFSVSTSVSIVMVMVAIQLALIVVQQFTASYVARSTARWLAVRIDTIDADVATQAATFAVGLPGLTGGGIQAVTVTPSCASLTSGKCAGRSSGDAITVQLTTNISRVMFLPTSYGIAPYKMNLPTSVPALAFTVMLE